MRIRLLTRSSLEMTGDILIVYRVRCTRELRLSRDTSLVDDSLSAKRERERVRGRGREGEREIPHVRVPTFSFLCRRSGTETTPTVLAFLPDCPESSGYIPETLPNRGSECGNYRIQNMRSRCWTCK